MIFLPLSLNKFRKSQLRIFRCGFCIGTIERAFSDEANFRDEADQSTLNAACIFCSLLEDSHREAVALVDGMERRFKLDVLHHC